MAVNLTGSGGVPTHGLTVEAAALVAAALAVATRLGRNGPAGPITAACVLAAAVVAGLVGAFPAPNDPNWHQIHLWWAAVIPVSLVLL